MLQRTSLTESCFISVWDKYDVVLTMFGYTQPLYYFGCHIKRGRGLCWLDGGGGTAVNLVKGLAVFSVSCVTHLHAWPTVKMMSQFKSNRS